jgi:general secretion pathway protein E
VDDTDIPTTAEAEEPVEEALGRRLVAAGKLQAAGLERARRVAQNGPALHLVLTRLGLVTEVDMAEALAAELDLPLAGAADYPDQPLIEGSARFLKESRLMPLADSPEALVLAMADPLDAYALHAVELLANKRVTPWVGLPADIEAAIERAYGTGRSSIAEISDQAVGEVDEVAEEDVERLRDLASEAPVIRLVNLLITRAVERRASDVHIEPFENQLRVRYRIDGVLQAVDSPPSQLRAAIISRVKLMAKLNIAERRLPQDGRIKLAVRGKEIDLRVSTLATMHGESVVLRVLDRGSVELDFAKLGFHGPGLEAYLEALERPNGIVLVTGPTGSGKTTTLYASLARLNTPEKNILTVEDPIEYELEGVNQIQVKPQIGLTFAHVLRSMLRQDPDIIMVGEIRDIETAEISVQAALTGHLVLSTLHTNSAAGTVTRLLDMGVEDYLLTATINGIAAQRLVRTLCPECREPYRALPELVDQLRLERFAAGESVTLYRAKGCEACAGTGYRGRSSILETLSMTDTIRGLVLRRAEAGDIQKAAVGEGMRTMYEDGLGKAVAGHTTIEEVVRVTREV